MAGKRILLAAEFARGRATMDRLLRLSLALAARLTDMVAGSGVAGSGYRYS